MERCRARRNPAALESTLCQPGSFLCLAGTASTARRWGRLPSFLRTVLAMSSRLAPAARSAQIAPRANASKRAVLFMAIDLCSKRPKAIVTEAHCPNRNAKCLLSSPLAPILNFSLPPFPRSTKLTIESSMEENKLSIRSKRPSQH